MPRNAATSARGPAALGPYSPAVWSGSELFCSGQTPVDPADGKLITGDIGAQTNRVFDNLHQFVLEDNGLTMDDVVKCNVYLTDMADFAAMNAVYATRFTAPYPARTTVAVAGLPLGARVEIELLGAQAGVAASTKEGAGRGDDHPPCNNVVTLLVASRAILGGCSPLAHPSPPSRSYGHAVHLA